MISDDERREVAERLRDKKAECEERGYPWMCDDLILAIGYDHDYEAGDEIFDRLADLIEPPTQCPYYHSDRHYCSVHDDVVDRDALLALADELEEDACWEVQTPGDTSGAWRLKDACDRIREALGVES